MSPPLTFSLDTTTVSSEAPQPRNPSRVALSYELFPPRSDAAVEDLRRTIGELEATNPDYVSVTYGAGGSNRGTFLGLLRHLTVETRLRPLAHLTCVGHTRAELESIVSDLLDVGVRGVLALRGDRPATSAGSDQTPDDLHFAVQLVRLIRAVESERVASLAAGKVAIGVAAYPVKHPESPTQDLDVEVLLAKQAAGADFAITQVFFNPDHYCDLVRRARLAGVVIPIIPGLMPMTSLRRSVKLSSLSGVEAPAQLVSALESARDDRERQRLGVSATTELAQRVLEAGAPGLHLYTFNEHVSALEVLQRLDLGRA